MNQNMSLAVSKRPFNASAYEVDNTCRHLNGEDYEGLLITSVADLPGEYWKVNVRQNEIKFKK